MLPLICLITATLAHSNNEAMSGINATAHGVNVDASDDIAAPEGYSNKHYADVSSSHQRVWWRFTKVNTAEYITYRTTFEAGTVGWVGVGLSDTGGMKGLDACIAKKSGSEWTVEDYWFENGFEHIYDTDINLGGSNECVVEVREHDGSITFEITKEKSSCDDFDSEYNSAAYLLLAWGGSSTVSYHGRDTRGGSYVELIAGRPAASVNPVINTLEFRHSFELDDKKVTQFWCMYKEVDLAEDFYISHQPEAFGEPWYSKGQDIVHHILINECPNCAEFNKTGIPPEVSFRCDQDDIERWTNPGSFEQVSKGLWTPGIQLSRYPDNMSNKILKAGKQWVFHELHVENPKHYSGKQEVIHTYENIGKQETTVGSIQTWTWPIKLEPGHEQIDMWTQIPAAKLRNLTNNSEATFHSIGPHMHLTATWWEVYCIREGETVFHTQAVYDFNLQTHRRANYKYKPGDSMFLHWRFDTSEMTDVTMVGEQTFDEMAQIYMEVYPLADDQIYRVFSNAEVYQEYEDGSKYMIYTNWTNMLVFPVTYDTYRVPVNEGPQSSHWSWRVADMTTKFQDPEIGEMADDTTDWKLTQSRGGSCVPGAGAANPFPIKLEAEDDGDKKPTWIFVLIGVAALGLVLLTAWRLNLCCFGGDDLPSKSKDYDGVAGGTQDQEVEVAQVPSTPATEI